MRSFWRAATQLSRAPSRSDRPLFPFFVKREEVDGVEDFLIRLAYGSLNLATAFRQPVATWDLGRCGRARRLIPLVTARAISVRELEPYPGSTSSAK